MASILLSSGKTFKFEFISNPVADIIKGYLNHLQHVDVPVGMLDNISYWKSRTGEVLSKFVDTGKRLGIAVDPEKISQSYLNDIHINYEKNYPKDHNPLWHEFHELIHIHELFIHAESYPFSIVNYRELSGPLEKQFRSDYYHYGTLTAHRGNLYCNWSELGKMPMTYYKDDEPTDIDRICELMKPWLMLRARFLIALEDFDFSPDPQVHENFKQWFEPYREEWMRCYGLDSFDYYDIFKIIPIGHLDDIDGFEREMALGAKVIRCML